ncbi:hypothetical protein VaNZ11_001983 [Volvox africanus]|uniref:Uncharacterized protein n=1 Tax=Volvox africanus TaxID=51714 RepID=A0ABQ5RQV8_9CHLO|nr:hypothetical protein VaNZ11_001983 [Volvox africanus]
MVLPSCPSLAARSRCHRVAVHARFGRDNGLILGPGGPNNNGNSNQRSKEARLIIPGQQRQVPGGRLQRLLTPDKQQGGLVGGDSSFLPDDSTLGLVSEQGGLVGGPPTLNKYRPPAGFMNETLPDDASVNIEPQEMLNKLRARAGHWHELAKFIPALNSKGYNSSVIDEMTGITPAEQNKWVVSATVYESVKAAPSVRADVLRRFDGPGVDLLYPFRFLSAERRVAAAQYIVEQDLDPAMCEVLARSMKEYERRVPERAGFTDHPADCLAFKYLRDALECRKREDAMVKLELGLQVALSDGARQRLLELMDENPDADAMDSPGVAASLVLLRLSPDELGVRPVCVPGELGQVQPEDLQAAPRTTQSGAFGIFSVSMETTSETASPSGRALSTSWNWVALPQWRALSMARHPVALTVRDCAAVQAVLLGSKAKTDDDKRRLQGPGILVVDKAPETFEQLDETAWYLGLPEGCRTLQMVDGKRAAVLAARSSLFASVLFLARPPVKEVADRGTDLLQL